MEETTELKAMDDTEPTTAPAKTEDIFLAPKEHKSESADIVDKLHDTAVVSLAKNDEETNKRILEQAKSSIDNKLSTIEQDNATALQKSTYNANSEACQSYGIDNEVPVWQIKLMKAGHAFWFVIYFIIASVTICPVKVFFKGINSFIKSTWLAVAVAIIVYLAVTVVLPVISAYMGGLIGGSSATSASTALSALI